ncbi:MAG: ABC transporter ATP-binding protein [Geminicoccaceae bacterium]
MSDAKLEVVDVHKAFGPKTVLDGVSLRVTQGESLVVIGGSGTGKSVLLKCILGLLVPDAGRILIDGQDLAGVGRRERQKLRRQIGMLFQGGALFDSLPVWENVAFGAIQAGQVSRRAARDLAVRTLARVNLAADVAERFPAELSGGMQKRVSLARAIAMEPAILFFDEPTTGLDPITADVINALIRQVTRDMGATALSITHDMSSVRQIADQVAMLFEGKIIWQGPVAAIDEPDNDHVEQFVHGHSHGPIQVDAARTR